MNEINNAVAQIEANRSRQKIRRSRVTRAIAFAFLAMQLFRLETALAKVGSIMDEQGRQRYIVELVSTKTTCPQHLNQFKRNSTGNATRRTG